MVCVTLCWKYTTKGIFDCEWRKSAHKWIERTIEFHWIEMFEMRMHFSFIFAAQKLEPFEIFVHGLNSMLQCSCSWWLLSTIFFDFIHVSFFTFVFNCIHSNLNWKWKMKPVISLIGKVVYSSEWQLVGLDWLQAWHPSSPSVNRLRIVMYRLN